MEGKENITSSLNFLQRIFSLIFSPKQVVVVNLVPHDVMLCFKLTYFYKMLELGQVLKVSQFSMKFHTLLKKVSCFLSYLFT